MGTLSSIRDAKTIVILIFRWLWCRQQQRHLVEFGSDRIRAFSEFLCLILLRRALAESSRQIIIAITTIV
jgi:hypothetical protein